MEFSTGQLKSGKNRQRTESKILRKTQAIANLESKINFLEKGAYLSEDFVDSRAIKLKDTMMKNLVYNMDSLYGLSPEGAKLINGMSTETSEDNNIEQTVSEEQQKIAEAVRKIMEEKEKEKKVSKEPAAPPKNNSENGQQTSTENVTSDDIASAIQREMDKIKVNTNQSSIAKVNKFINDDGSYRLTKDDIDEDFRITRIDRSKLSEDDTNTTVPNVADVTPFDNVVRREQHHIEPPRKELTEIIPRTFNIEKSVTPNGK